MPNAALGATHRIWGTTATGNCTTLAQGLYVETLVFVSFIYWTGSYWMSRESQRLERRLGLGER